MIPKVTNFHVFFKIIVIEILLHPPHVTPVKIPLPLSAKVRGREYTVSESKQHMLV